ncbi:1773_t:CDS:2 [Gigaspora margarita]|uniref:1773_t:CDS:1 n=1 Tax=Gigaspora margarita TaxID=4874 RepID=A0ABN7VAJ8_GIGMA|nr:1773_t:CDS:2 [Gigaspora margarita]
MDMLKKLEISYLVKSIDLIVEKKEFGSDLAISALSLAEFVYELVILSQVDTGREVF